MRFTSGIIRPALLVVLAVCIVAIAAERPAEALQVSGSLHDFSISGVPTSPFMGNYVVTGGSGLAIDEPCVFCHTPHGASTDPKYNVGGKPSMLWNRTVPRGGNYGTSFTLYQSPSLTKITVQNPTGLSLMCLSCHDGVTSIAVGSPLSGTQTLLNSPGPGNNDITKFNPALQDKIGAVPGPLTDYLNIGNLAPGNEANPINLSDDHPVAFAWVTGITGITDPDGQGNFAVTGGGTLRLWNNRMECSTCHNVHDNAIRPFLRASNAGSVMCLACHTK